MYNGVKAHSQIQRYSEPVCRSILVERSFLPLMIQGRSVGTLKRHRESQFLVRYNKDVKVRRIQSPSISPFLLSARFPAAPVDDLRKFGLDTETIQIGPYYKSFVYTLSSRHVKENLI